MREVIRQNELGYLDPETDGDVDFEFLSPNQFVGPNVGLIPLQNAVQPTRLFYGARFANQALPVINNEPPLVQSASDLHGGQAFDQVLGRQAGAVFADEDGVVEDVQDQRLKLRTASGVRDIPLHRYLPFNRYSGLHQTPVVKPGQTVTKGTALARSNFTDANGVLAMGLNARIGLVPYKGFSMDDAIVVSEDFAKRATTHHIDTLAHNTVKNGAKGGMSHFISMFPDAFNRDQLSKLDEEGAVLPGTIVQKGDPLVLATRPRNMNSAQSKSLGMLSRQATYTRTNAALTWDNEDPGTVTDVVRKKDGTVKVVVESLRPMRKGDKMVLRSGNKDIVSAVIPQNEMPRTADGRPLDILLNHQGIPSRANPALPLELLYGKLAAATGKPVVLPAFNKYSDSWVRDLKSKLAAAGLSDKEQVYDPKDNRMLAKPITVGHGYVLRLHHLAEGKVDSRGQASYDQQQQPLKGGSEGGGAKRRSGLEVVGMMSAGAYNNLRENVTLSGAQNDDYWRALRAGSTPAAPGVPFVWHKFRALLRGVGADTVEHGDGNLRLSYMTDKSLDKLKPLPLKNGEIVSFKDMSPVAGGLFDTALVGGSRWGSIDLPEPLPNPAAEDTIRQLLGLTRKQFEAVLAGNLSLTDLKR